MNSVYLNIIIIVFLNTCLVAISYSQGEDTKCTVSSLLTKLTHQNNTSVKFTFNSKAINHPKYHLWDNWGFEEDGIIHVYSLAADKSLRAGERHFSAHWRHFISKTNGQSWEDLGSVVRPSGKKRDFLGKSIWSGSVTKMKNGTYWAAITGVEEGSDVLQTISIGISHDAHSFRLANPAKPLLDHRINRNRWKNLGYYISKVDDVGKLKGEPDNTIQALRDPFIFQASDGSAHIFWASKMVSESGRIKPAIGHLKISDLNKPDKFELQKAISIPDDKSFTELELPNVVEMENGKIAWVISTTNRKDQSQSIKDIIQDSRIYYSDSIGSPLRTEGKNIILEGQKSKLYGINFVQGSREGEEIKARAFYLDEISGDKQLTLPSNFILNLEKKTILND